MTVKRFEGFISGFNDTRLFFQVWRPTQPRALLLVTHGQGEHSGAYHRFVKAMEDSSFEILAWDWRGHGKSEGHRGYAKDFSEYVYDYERVIQHAISLKGNRPLMLVSHSMGGLIQLKALTENPNIPVTAQALSSPLLGLAKKVPIAKDLAAIVLKNFVPQITLWNEIQNSDLTSENEIIEEFTKDELRHAKISSGVYLGSLDAMEFVKQRAAKINIPSLFQIPNEDLVVSSPKTREFVDAMSREKAILIEYKKSRHEIFNDQERDAVFSDLKSFLEKNL